jgi:hypothetical protein
MPHFSHLRKRTTKSDLFVANTRVFSAPQFGQIKFISPFKFTRPF